MHSERFTVKYVTVQNCFVYLPDTRLRQLTLKPADYVTSKISKARHNNINDHYELPNDAARWHWGAVDSSGSNVVQITHNDRELYFSWHPRPAPDDTLGISATFARVLGIKEGDYVYVTTQEPPPTVSNLVVAPRNSQDWEIVELQSNKIQDSLLSQITIVATNQEIIVWISTFLSIVLIVESIESSVEPRCGRLQAFTEITVSSPVTKQKHPDCVVKHANENPWGIFGNFLSKIRQNASTTKDCSVQKDPRFLNSRRENLPATFRVLPFSINVQSLEGPASLLAHPFNVFVKKDFLPKHYRSSSIFCRVTKIPENPRYVRVTNTNFLREEQQVGQTPGCLVVRVMLIEDLVENVEFNLGRSNFEHDSVHRSIFISETLRRNLKLKTGSKVMLELADPPSVTLNSIEIIPFGQTVSANDLKQYVSCLTTFDKMLVNSVSRLFLRDDLSCIMKIASSQPSHFLIEESDLNQIDIRVMEAKGSLGNEMENVEETRDTDLGVVSDKAFHCILDNCQSTLRLSLGLSQNLCFEYDRENILICGKPGSGKTTVCRRLTNTFRNSPNYVHVGWIDCKSLKGKKVETLHKAFSQTLLECIYYQPSILILDDLESIAGKILNDEENTPDAINAARTADMVINVLTEYQSIHYISVVATCYHTNKISDKLVAPRGVHLFRSILSLPDLEKDVRIDILRLALQAKVKVSDDVDWNHYGNKSEGWQARDLITFTEKAIFTAWKRHVKRCERNTLTIVNDDLVSSLERSTPVALQGIGLYSGPGHAWADIGGLAAVKQSLIELLNWPLKYPELFKNAPIKLQGGVLLYGAPGTGKTMLAGAIAKECGLNFISVKGPELLSKYIGASEEAVRNVFEKANSAKPCVLFFDEFDSLAPRRGQDSTGVTDRVVNQFLAQLDGVEGRQGVAVVAASSRPDLLDPALLRPGRLDKTLLCSIPNQNEREEILRALCHSQGMDESSFDLKDLSSKSEGFTGADLNAIISQARLTVLQESLALSKRSEENGEFRMGIVTYQHLLDALAATRPSLSTSEKLKYDKIYARFSKGDNFSDDLRKNQRATLA